MLIELILIALLVIAYLYWLNGQRAKEIAHRMVSLYCQSKGVQMLDDYIALYSIRPKWGKSGKIQACRIYSFEFSSTGNERYNGICIMVGLEPESIQLEPHRFDD